MSGFHFDGDIAPKRLWTPDRDIALDPAGANVETVQAAEMRVMEGMHAIAQRHGIVLACERCRRPFHGYNASFGDTQAISCGCRTLQARVRSARVMAV